MTTQYARPEYLVTAQWLNEHLADPQVRVLDTRSPALYEAGHIPGALLVDVRNLHPADTGPTAMHDWIARLEEACSVAGITDRHQVVFYEETSGEIAPRGVWALTYLGHGSVRLLDGGLTAWRAGGYAMSRSPSSVRRVVFRARPRPELVATRECILEHLLSPTVRVLDVRRAAEYTGVEIRARRGGHIPGAIHHEWLHNLADDGTYKRPGELARAYAHLGLAAHQTIIPYCQHGYRSANTWLALTLLGYAHVRNYLGSWEEWGNHDGLPIARNAPGRVATVARNLP
ncbi:MAG TPA: sulfurtransferase [Chloroflexota bacterium]|jgi:thiosulfate/3-mercaptopyruvate sulfurtransferase